MSPAVIQKYFSNVPLNYDPFEVTNIHAKSRCNHSITLPSFNEFNDPGDVTFFVYKFHNFFDGLIGTDLLDKWEATIDYKNKLFKTKTALNPIQIYNSCNVNLYENIIPAGTSKLIKLPINVHEGDVYIKEQTVSNCIIGECITTVTNNRGIVEIKNPSRNDVIFSMDRAISADVYNTENNPSEEQQQRIKNVLSRLRTDHLNVEERKNLELLCARYSDIFYMDGEPLTFTSKIKHSIKTTDEAPIYTKSYRYPFIHRQEVKEQISKMLEQGIIRPSNSAWSSPIWVVAKKPDASGQTKWRIVVDFRKVNEKTIDDRYPIPNIADVLDKLGRSQYFTTLDLASGFYQVEMNPQDIPKTAFNVEHGHYEFLRMPMGLKNSPSTFQRVMDNVLKDLQNTICLVYLDDIIVFSTSLQEHIINLEKVFQKLRESNFKIQLDKSEFLKLETAYLGHIISKDGVKPNPDKISAIQNYPLPKTSTEIKRFIGLLGYYRKFIPDFAKVTKPMTQCLKKGSKITLNENYVECFEKCKTLLINDPILQYPDFSKEFILTTDASNFAIGAVLSQGVIGADKPISFASRTLNTSEINYSTIEKELLAIVWATKYFRPYLFGRKFKIVTDHRPLQWVMNIKEPNSRLTRWRLYLSEFDFTVIFKQGKNNTNADALSRIEVNNGESISLVVNTSERADSDSRTESIDSKTDSAHSDAESPILEIPISEDPLNKFNKQIIFNVVSDDIERSPTISKPFATHTRICIQISESNLQQNIINAIKEYVNPKVKTGILINPVLKMYSIIPILQDHFQNSAMNLVITKKEIENITEYIKQQDIIKNYHIGKTNHRGINESYLALSRRYYWPKMKEQIAKYINECNVCGRAKYDRNPVKPRFQVVPPPTKPFEIVHLDLFSIETYKYLTIIDAFSKYAQAYFLRDATAISVIQALLTFSTHHGLPLTVITDNGPEFTNQLFQEFIKMHKILHHRICPNTPNENGMVERLHLTLLEHLRILRLEHRGELVTNLMPYALLAYNYSIHSFTKCRPIDIITGHIDPRDPLDIDVTEYLMQQYVQDHKKRMLKVYDIINETALQRRSKIIENVNKDRELEKEYSPDQDVYIQNPLAIRQKLAARYIHDKVLEDLPIHIYTRKKKGRVPKSRLKRIPNSSRLFQDTENTARLDTGPNTEPGTSRRNST